MEVKLGDKDLTLCTEDFLNNYNDLPLVHDETQRVGGDMLPSQSGTGSGSYTHAPFSAADTADIQVFSTIDNFQMETEVPPTDVMPLPVLYLPASSESINENMRFPTHMKTIDNETIFEKAGNYIKALFGLNKAQEEEEAEDYARKARASIFTLLDGTSYLDNVGAPLPRKDITEMSYARDPECGSFYQYPSGNVEPALYNEVVLKNKISTPFDMNAIISGASYNDKLVDSMFAFSAYKDPRISSCTYEYAPGIGKVQVTYVQSDNGVQSPLVILPKMTPHDIRKWNRIYSQKRLPQSIRT